MLRNFFARNNGERQHRSRAAKLKQMVDAILTEDNSNLHCEQIHQNFNSSNTMIDRIISQASMSISDIASEGQINELSISSTDDEEKNEDDNLFEELRKFSDLIGNVLCMLEAKFPSEMLVNQLFN